MTNDSPTAARSDDGTPRTEDSFTDPNGTEPAADGTAGVDPTTHGRPRWTTLVGRAGIGIFAVTMVVFWTWAMFLADPEPINRIDDVGWTARAEQRCSATMQELQGLANFTTIAPGDSDQIAERADIIERANGALTTMIDDVTNAPPTDVKGQALIPQWTAEYRTYLNDRELYVDKLRTEGRNLAFEETMTEDGIPVSERLATFAADNRMPSCSPPHDLR